VHLHHVIIFLLAYSSSNLDVFRLKDFESVFQQIVDCRITICQRNRTINHATQNFLAELGGRLELLFFTHLLKQNLVDCLSLHSILWSFQREESTLSLTRCFAIISRMRAIVVKMEDGVDKVVEE